MPFLSLWLSQISEDSVCQGISNDFCLVLTWRILRSFLSCHLELGFFKSEFKGIQTLFMGNIGVKRLSILSRCIHEHGKLHTNLYIKPTEKQQYVYSYSCHPKHTKNSLLYCLALRFQRICSEKICFNQRAKEMELHLIQRGYTKGCIREALVDVTNDNQLTRVPFVVTYNPKLPSLPKILKESQSIKHASERYATVFPEVPLVSNRRSRNLTTCYVADVLHLTPLQSQIETLIPAAATTISPSLL